jgi:HEAT repeat protein
MKKCRNIFVFVLAMALLGIGLSVNWREPWYHWKPLSSWLAEYGAGPGDYKPSPKTDNALRQIGSNAVPYLLNLLCSTNSYAYYTFVVKENQRGMYPVSVWTPRLSTVGEHLKAWSINLRARFQRVTVPASWDHWKAYLAFQALGSAGSSAIPDLVKLAHDPDANSSPSNTETPPIRFWKDKKEILIFVAQSSTYLSHGSPVIPISVFLGGGGFVPQPFLSDGEIAAWSLAAIGPDSVPPLMEMLTNSNPQIRCRAAMALGMMGKPAEPAVPALVNLLHDSDRNTRREAADALGWIGQQPDFVLPALIKAFDDREVEDVAIASLGAFGERATNAITASLALFQAEYNSQDQTRGQYRSGEIALALNKISSDTTRKEVIPFLIYRIQNPESPWSKSMTLNTLGQMTNQPDLVIPVLLEALDSTTNYTRSTIVYQLGDFGLAATSAIPKLISFSTNQDTNLCRLATNALDKIKPSWRTNH